ncbi:hypothetical protein RQP46_010203 [Phenoliferia psychrophenolica]
MSRILITGGAGYIGSHVALDCILSGYRVVVIDNFTRSSDLASEEHKASCEIDFHLGDVTRKEDLERVFSVYENKGGIFGVIHFAALKAVGQSGVVPLNYYETNVCGTAFLLQTMAKFGTQRFVYSSSATVYGAPTVIPIPESTPLQPESCYGRTKFMSELIMKDAAAADPSLRAISLRYFNPAGAHPSGRMGEAPRGRPENLLPLLAQIAIGKHKDSGLEVFGNDYPTRDGTCVRDYIHIMDLAQAHIVAFAALENDKTFATPSSVVGTGFGSAGGRFKAYNVGNGRGMSVLQMIDAMKKATGFDSKYKIVGRR